MERLSSELPSDPPSDSLDHLEIAGASEAASETQASQPNGTPEWAASIEARVDVLEAALFDHATVLRDRVAERLERLEATLQRNQHRMETGLSEEARLREEQVTALTDTFTRAFDRLAKEEPASAPLREVKPVEYSTRSVDPLTDLVDALTATRTHLDTVATAIQQTRAELSA